MELLIVGVAGVLAGLFLATRIEVWTGRCVLYWYDRIFHSDWTTEK